MFFTLPDLGEGLQDAEIVAWFVSAGDRVVADQPLVSVETDKAVVEVPAPAAGRIGRLCAEVGQRLAVGAPLVELDDGEAHDAGSVVGRLDGVPTAVPPPAATFRPAAAAATGRAVPAVRALARERGVDLATLAGSGPDGQITKADVERAAAVTQPALTGLTELSGPRRAMALRMAQAHAEVVPATVTEWVDVEAWADQPHTVTLRLVQAVAAAAAAEPSLNAGFDGARLARRVNAAVDLGIAVDTPDGLFVPVLKDVGGKDAATLAAEIESLKAAVRDRAIPPEALRGQTITLSNFGAIAGCHAQLTVVPPQVAIIGAGRLRARPVAVGGRVEIHRLLPLSLTFDHRAVTGGEATRFLAALTAHLERTSA